MPDNRRFVFAVESLESRRLLSAIHPLRVHQPPPPGFGAIGDSDTAAYQLAKGFPTTAYNFVEQLSMANIAYFGPYSTRPHRDGLAGYAYDVGFGGATSANMAQQVSNLLPAIRNGDLQYVTIMLGGNDFENALLAAHPKAALRALPSVVWSNLLAGINQLQAADPNLRIAVSTLYPIEDEPDKIALVQNGVIGGATLRLADQEQDIVNAQIRRLARHNSNIVCVDFESQFQAIESQPTYTLGDVTVTTTTTGSDPHNFWLKDGEHYGTIEQGLWGNLIVDSINAKFGTTFSDLSIARILGAAGLT